MEKINKLILELASFQAALLINANACDDDLGDTWKQLKDDWSALKNNIKLYLIDGETNHEIEGKGEADKNEFISFSAMLNGEPVRLTASLKDFDIVDRGNVQGFDVEEFGKMLKEIEFEDIY